MLNYLIRPSKEELEPLLNLIEGGDFVFVETNFNGGQDHRSLMFNRGKLLFISSNHSVLGIENPENNGVSAIINPMWFEDESNDFIKLQKEMINDLQKSDLYYHTATNYDKMLKGIHKIGKERENDKLYNFFIKYRTAIEPFTILH